MSLGPLLGLRTQAAEARYAEVEQEMKNRLLHRLTTAGEPDQIAPEWLRPN
ncbi:MAG: hypothetical protein IIA67_15105 [Planctomycetes bacterium]|nr:hypothetical protein [Planctomycetota bacterium]